MGNQALEKQIISRGYLVSGSLTWDRIIEYDNSDSLGILALHPYNSNYPSAVIYGLGNRWDYTKMSIRW